MAAMRSSRTDPAGAIGIGEHHGSRPELADRGCRLRQLALDHRKRARPGKAGHQLAVVVIGNDENRAWKRHGLLGFPEPDPDLSDKIMLKIKEIEHYQFDLKRQRRKRVGNLSERC